ncbi:hypothetical protein SAMN03097699_2671 [Flavobacteriaceae bacterium MAR_2010_188]|nr:hypothetical protein SAMN03097699_2671 [Flavobacteriaceae bacterium MAR_2010_188]
MADCPKINIIFRSCDVVNAVNKSPRPFGLDKKTLIKICFNSLYKASKGYNCNIIVVGDNLSDEMKSFYLKNDIQLIEGVFGNDNSIRKTLNIASDFDESEWVYFCEDDYLHEPGFFENIVSLIKEKESLIPGRIRIKKLLKKRYITLLSFPRYFTKPGVVIFPCNYPDRYKPEYMEKSFIFKTSTSHWRQVSDTTFTFLIQVSDIKKYSRVLLKSSHRANDRYLSANLYGKSFFFNKLLCLSPLPSLSTHMHTETMSPTFGIERLVNQLKQEI